MFEQRAEMLGRTLSIGTERITGSKIAALCSRIHGELEFQVDGSSVVTTEQAKQTSGWFRDMVLAFCDDEDCEVFRRAKEAFA